MKFKKSITALALLLMAGQASAQTTPRPIFASSVYNGAGVLFIPTSTPLGNRACVFDNNSVIASSSVTSTELGFLSGATSNIQAQINSVTSGAVTSVFGRSGAIIGVSGDYAAFYPLRANNLSDLASASAARTNLGLGSAATQSSSAFDVFGSAAAAQAAAIAASDSLGAAAAAQAASLQKASNLSDLASATTARTNLGLGAAATKALSFFAQTANNLSDLTSASSARTNLGLGSAATQASSAFDAAGAATSAQAASLQKASNLSDVASASSARTNLGLGSAATQASSAFDAAGAAASAQAAAIAASDSSGAAAAVLASSLQKASNLSDLASAATARTNLGLGTAATNATSFFDASGAAAAAQAASLQKASNLSDLANVVTARGNLGLGSAALQPTSAFDASGAAAAAQAAAQAASDPLGSAATAQATSLQKASNLSDLASPSNARTNLGLGTAATHSISFFETPLTFSGSLLRTVNDIALVNDAANPGNNQVYGTDGFGLKGWYPASVVSGSGTVTSVSLTVPSWLSVAGSPITTFGTLAVTASSQAQNLFLASPDGVSGAMSPRPIVAADIPTLNQNTTGNAATVTTNANLTGPVTSVGNATSVTANAITNAMLAQMAAHTYKGNNTGSTANATDVTSTQLTADLDLFSSTLQGLVPASGGGTTNFLRADGSWSPAGTGTVTSVTASAPLVSSGGTTPDISIPVATSLVDGFLSAVDWAIFNAKQAALTFGNLTDAGTDGVTVTGGTGAVIGSGTSISQHVSDTTHNGYLASTDWNTFNGKQAALSFGNFTDAGTDGITVTGGTGSVIGSGTSISQHVADATHAGFLASADWVTFNAKQNALTPGSISTSTTGVSVGSGSSSTVGPNVTVNVQTASTSQPGLLSSADWNTFNGKQAALGYTPLDAAGTIPMTADLNAAGNEIKGLGGPSTPGSAVSKAYADALVIPLATQVSGNLATSHLNSGTGATSGTFWRGDGTWAAPSSSGSLTNSTISTSGTITPATGAATGAIITATSTQTLANCTSTGPWTLHISNFSTGGVVTLAVSGSNTFSDGQVSGQTSYQLATPGLNIWVECTTGDTLYVTR